MVRGGARGRGLVRFAVLALTALASVTLGRVAEAAPVFMAAPGARVTTCVPGYQSVVVPTPSVVGAAEVSGQVVAVNAVPLATPVPLVNGTAILPLGLHQLAWTATAPDGTTTTLQQALRVEETVSAACCAPEQTLVQGTGDANAFIKLQAKPWCVLAAGGPDLVATGTKADFIAATR